MKATARSTATRSAALALLALGLGACAATNESEVADGAVVTTPERTVSTADFVQRSDYCPPIQIRAGTSTMTVYERGGENDPKQVRYLASISQTARECTMTGDTLTMKVGIAGRVVAGPKGSATSVTLPVRVAVAKQFGGTGPLYTHLYQIPITLAAPSFGANFNQVLDQIVVTAGPGDRNLIIYVGFDEGPNA